MDPSLLAWMGGLGGSLIGLLGGALGTWIPYRNAHSPREKAFVLKAAAFFWVFVLAFVAGLLFVPSPYNLLLWIPYIVVLVVSIQMLNRMQARIRAEENAANEKPSPESSQP